MTGHRVTARATDTWDPAVYGASMTDDPAVAGAPGTVAFSDAYGCDSCHNAAMSDGSSAFPHGYVDATGAVSAKTVAGSSLVWLTTASDATGSDSAILATDGLRVSPYAPSDAEDLGLTKDGLCLKCPRDGAGAGVGLSF
jgi:hypothetical protein